MAFPSYDFNTYFSAGTETSFSINVSGVEVDDYLFAVIIKDDGDAILTPPDGTWTQKKNADSGGAVRTELWFKTATVDDVEIGFSSGYIRDITDIIPDIPSAQVSVLKFSDDGYKLFVPTDTRILQFNLTTPFDTTTIPVTFSSEYDVVDDAEYPRAMVFTNNGLTLFTVSGITASVRKWSLSTAFEIDTMSYVGEVLTLAEGYVLGAEFSPDGLTFFHSKTTTKGMYKYDLATPFDLSTAVYDQYVSNLSKGNFTFSEDGLRLYSVTGNIDYEIIEQFLSVAWDITSTITDGVNNVNLGQRIYAITYNKSQTTRKLTVSRYSTSTSSRTEQITVETKTPEYIWSGDSEEYTGQLFWFRDYSNLWVYDIQIGNSSLPTTVGVFGDLDYLIVAGIGVDGSHLPHSVTSPDYSNLFSIQSSGGGSGSVGATTSYKEYLSGLSSTVKWTIDASDEWCAWAIRVIGIPDPTGVVGNADLISTVSTLSATGATFNVISGNADLISELSTFESTGQIFGVISGNANLVSEVSEFYASNILIKQSSSLFSYNIEAIQGIQQEKTLFKIYINNIEFSMVGFTLQLISTINVNTGTKNFSGLIVASTKAEIDFIQSNIGNNLKMDVVYSFASGITLTRTIFNGILNLAIKGSGSRMQTLSLLGLEDYVTSQNKTHNRNDIIFKSDATMRLPMDLQILTGDYINSNYGFFRIKNITHYFYIGTAPKTELGAT